MNGIHDMGGMDGFGEVQPQDSEPFHEPWEKQVWAASALVGTLRGSRITIESMSPDDYLSHGYYGRWLYVVETRLVKNGLATEEELKNPDGRLARVDGYQAVRAEEVEGRQTWRSNRMQVDFPPKFQIGDRVMVKNEHPKSYTRCPRYFRGRQGQVHMDHGVYPFPDTIARLGPQPQHCYSIRFAATELWGSRANPKDVVYADLFEDYLEQR